MSVRKQHGCNGQLFFQEKNSLPAPMNLVVRVIDPYGYPLVGAHVQSATTNFATISNANGFAELEGFGNEKFVFSHIGKETRTIPFSELSNGEVVLEDFIEPLDEVVITNKPKRKHGFLWIAAALGLGYVMFRKQPKKVNL